MLTTMIVLAMAIMAFSVAGPAAASNRYWAIDNAKGTHDYRMPWPFVDGIPQSGDVSYPANKPFYVAHGYVQSPWADLGLDNQTAFMGPATYFELLIDGVLQHSSKCAKYTPASDSKSKIFITEDDIGMTGTHTFEGKWYADGLLVEGTPGEAVLTADAVIVVTFVD